MTTPDQISSQGREPQKRSDASETKPYVRPTLIHLGQAQKMVRGNLYLHRERVGRYQT